MIEDWNFFLVFTFFNALVWEDKSTLGKVTIRKDTEAITKTSLGSIVDIFQVDMRRKFIPSRSTENIIKVCLMYFGYDIVLTFFFIPIRHDAFFISTSVQLDPHAHGPRVGGMGHEANLWGHKRRCERVHFLHICVGVASQKLEGKKDGMDEYWMTDNQPCTLFTRAGWEKAPEMAMIDARTNVRTLCRYKCVCVFTARCDECPWRAESPFSQMEWTLKQGI